MVSAWLKPLMSESVKFDMLYELSMYKTTELLCNPSCWLGTKGCANVSTRKKTKSKRLNKTKRCLNLWLDALFFLMVSNIRTFENCTFLAFLKLKRWMMIGIARASRPHKKNGYVKLINDKSKTKNQSVVPLLQYLFKWDTKKEYTCQIATLLRIGRMQEGL